MADTLNDLLVELLSVHADGILKHLKAIEEDEEENTTSIASVAADVSAIKSFVLGVPSGHPGAVTAAQLAETLAKVQTASALVNKFNP